MQHAPTSAYNLAYVALVSVTLEVNAAKLTQHHIVLPFTLAAHIIWQDQFRDAPYHWDAVSSSRRLVRHIVCHSLLPPRFYAGRVKTRMAVPKYIPTRSADRKCILLLPDKQAPSCTSQLATAAMCSKTLCSVIVTLPKFPVQELQWNSCMLDMQATYTLSSLKRHALTNVWTSSSPRTCTTPRKMGKGSPPASEYKQLVEELSSMQICFRYFSQPALLAPVNNHP